jgi:hypothetical protein
MQKIVRQHDNPATNLRVIEQDLEAIKQEHGLNRRPHRNHTGVTVCKICRSADVPALGAKYSSVEVGWILPFGSAPSSPAALALPIVPGVAFRFASSPLGLFLAWGLLRPCDSCYDKVLVPTTYPRRESWWPSYIVRAGRHTNCGQSSGGLKGATNGSSSIMNKRAKPMLSRSRTAPRVVGGLSVRICFPDL